MEGEPGNPCEGLIDFDLIIMSNEPLIAFHNQYMFQKADLIDKIKFHYSDQKIISFLKDNLSSKGSMFAFVTRRLIGSGITRNFIDLEVSPGNKNYFS